MKSFLLILIVFLVSCAEQRGDSSGTAKTLVAEVEVTGGKIVGKTNEDGLFEFLGVPYAAAPVGNLRWQRP